ncbi:uncharacterized protein [Gossypium hirsutum]|uniref:Gag-pol polyprotein n=1 Tax=Gossypium hirsutum TaxID=3635 RepID=A0A1U8NYJ0_GOSHI|nr:uncharacterized protein LOC107952383 [Gossypium hirsutum]
MSDESIEGTDHEMYSRGESYDVHESESTTPSVNPVGNQPPNTRRDNTEIFRMIAKALQRAVGTMLATTSTPATRRAPIKELQKYRATEFLGSKGMIQQQLKIEFVDLVEKAKMIEQVLGKSKKSETIRSAKKRPRTASSSLQFKRSRESRECEYSGNGHREECRKLTGGCFQCGSTNHFVKDFPKIGKSTPMVSQRFESAFRGRGLGRSGPAARGEPVYALIDPGSSHSYVNTKLVENGNLKSELSRITIEVSSPLGKIVLVNQICRRCPLMIQDRIFSVDLLIMPFGYFDIILGMDWLSEHGVILDCYKKKFTVQNEDGKWIEVNGIRTSGSAQIISVVKASKLLYQGYAAFLAYVINSNSAESQCSKIQTVCEFPDVFPK